MKLKMKTIQELKEILARDYATSLNDEDLNTLGVSLLKLTRIAITALTRENEQSFFGAREETL